MLRREDRCLPPLPVGFLSLWPKSLLGVAFQTPHIHLTMSLPCLEPCMALWCPRHKLCPLGLVFQAFVLWPAFPPARLSPPTLCQHSQSTPGCFCLWASSDLCYSHDLKCPFHALHLTHSTQELTPQEPSRDLSEARCPPPPHMPTLCRP